eukprot:m.178230 g.178230  ORF g.178230 m.178230 type:complete len:311 (+) comp13557_c1_seq1:50-982(+)
MGSSCSSQKGIELKKEETVTVNEGNDGPSTFSSPVNKLNGEPTSTSVSNSTVTVVFVRHGESEWNRENKFTGWVDVGLTDKGAGEAIEAGRILKDKGFVFDIAFSSVLKRSIRTCNYILEEMDQLWIPVEKDYRLNERMYGALAGLNKQDTVAKHGINQVMVWRRSFDTPPPEAEASHEFHPLNDPKYRHLQINEKKIPKTESLKTTLARVLPYWLSTIAPAAQKGEGKVVLVAAHGNSIRAILKYIDNIPDDIITTINIPTGVPLVYTFDKATMAPIQAENAAQHLSGTYLISDDELQRKMAKVANQTK